MFPAEAARQFGGQTAQGLARGVDEIPVALDGLVLGDESLHVRTLQWLHGRAGCGRPLRLRRNFTTRCCAAQKRRNDSGGPRPPQVAGSRERPPAPNRAKRGRPGYRDAALLRSLLRRPRRVPSPPSTPPAAGSLQALADRCVQCGLCLPVCPTYAQEPLETESPRGRIALLKAWDNGTLAPTEAGDAHLDHCLGCRRCESVCPAGVEYGALLTLGRAQQRQRRRPGIRQRTAEALAARPRLRAGVFALYRRAWPWLPAAWRPMPRPPAETPRPPGRPAPRINEDASATVAVFVGCFAEHYEGPARAALARLLAALGIDAAFPDHPSCCGALHAHAGDTDRAATLSRAVSVDFASADIVLSLASGCHGALGETLGERAVDALAFLAQRADALSFSPCRERIALHVPCTQRTVAKSDDALRRLLARVPDLELVALDAGFGCCGAAGTQMLTDPERAARFRRPLLDPLAGSGATRLLSANIGCRLHLANGTEIPVQHPLEFLAERLI
ncbi:MAG: (Fe-S)-binding protein [Lysobacter sp.]|nr:MAG: (Fe-S)-binding protein [Lysobacter sp.]